tara:strand:+ start:610 stop:990 length:381 start_codon:yes stop_codon:yes gene_type:complete
MEFKCGESIYQPDTSGREILDCEITISNMAASKLHDLITESEPYLYFTVQGGGCSGYIYDMDLLGDEPTSAHQVIQIEGITIVVHNLDSSLLTGVLIDYEDKLMGGGFTISNPNATRTCGCGLSFK